MVTEPWSLRAFRQAAELDDLQAEYQDAVEHAVERRLVEIPGQRRISTVVFNPEIPEDVAADLTQGTGNDDPVPVRRHGASVRVQVLTASCVRPMPGNYPIDVHICQAFGCLTPGGGRALPPGVAGPYRRDERETPPDDMETQ